MDRFLADSVFIAINPGVGRLDFAIPDTSPLLSLRTVPLCAPCILGQGCSSQGMDFLLWKVVEKTVRKENAAGRRFPQIKNGERPVCPRILPGFSSWSAQARPQD